MERQQQEEMERVREELYLEEQAEAARKKEIVRNRTSNPNTHITHTCSLKLHLTKTHTCSLKPHISPKHTHYTHL